MRSEAPEPDDSRGVVRLSVVLPTDSPATIRQVLALLGRQSVAKDTEVVLVTTDPQALERDTAGDDRFAAVRVVGVASLSPLGRARAAGIRAASGEFVFLGETHSYPGPGWAEALLSTARSGPWDAVASGMDNANPATALSWAGFLADYARWSCELPAGEIGEAPIYNTLYRREVLLGVGESLGEMLSHGDSLRRELQGRGCRSFLQPSARLAHVNIDVLLPCVRERILAGILIGTQRAGRWPWWRRLAYAGGSVLIPAVLVGRMLPAARQVARVRSLPRGSMLLLLPLGCLKALGEMLGYLGLGRPVHAQAMDHLEVRKLDYVGSRK